MTRVGSRSLPQGFTVENTRRPTRTGGAIHGQRVTFPDGYTLDFIDRTTKHQAIAQAIQFRNTHPETHSS